MDFNEYMKDKRIFACNDSLTSMQSLELLLSKQNDFDIVKYPYLKKILILNIPMMEKDNDGNYYYDYELQRDCDFISDFTINANDNPNVKFSFVCGLFEYKLEELKVILLAACMYTPIKLRITFNEKKEKEIIFTCYKYLCNRNISYYLMKNKMITPVIIYNEGVCLKNHIIQYS